MTIGTPDLFIMGIIGLSIIIGIFRGLIKESISLATWICAIILAVMYVKPLAVYMTFTKVEFVKNLTAFLIIFIGIIFIGAIFNYFVSALVRKTPFSLPDRVLGSFFGLFRGIVFVGILTFIAGLTPFPEEKWWKESYFIGHFQKMALWLREQLPEDDAKNFQFPGDKQEVAVDKDHTHRNVDKD